MTKDDCKFLSHQLVAAILGRAMPAWRSPEFARLLALLEHISLEAVPRVELDPALRDIAIVALYALLGRLEHSAAAQAEFEESFE